MTKYQGVYPNLPTFLERINYAFDNIPLSQTQFAASVGITQPTFSNFLKGKNKTCEKLDVIAEKLGVDYQWLVTGVSNELGNTVSFVNIGLLEDFNEYVNTRSLANIKRPDNSVQLDIRALVNRQINFFDARYIPMTDTGMSPIIKKDASIFFDRSKNFIEDGKSYVIAHGGMIQVRQLFNAALASVKIQAANPDFENTTLDIDQQSDQLFSILGQVFAVTNYY
jgi:transcriptional regulator with XRE-family HTH domain